ncbi:UNKNOWN [Stylonychia lemnae]|uniref:ZNFX1 domain-containing protein n=1 Tax=Stylonychia lemnae TaxID=5949 RepID=A0A078A0C0_STYLE|nr:UNKNOWN [Stylonychia lemnae]|eukprot:CDW74883.1 UNKNOWN [Stylonychia lemnae]
MQRGRARGSGGYRYQQQQQMTLQDLQRIQQYEEEKKNQPQGASRFNLAAGNYYPKQSYQNIMQNNIPLDIGNVINMLSQELNNNSQNYDQQVPTWSNRNQNDTFYNQQPVPSYQQNQTNFQPKSAQPIRNFQTNNTANNSYSNPNQTSNQFRSGFGTVSQSKNNESHHSIQQSPTTQEQISENETFRGGRGSRGTRGDRGDRGGYRGRAERRGFDNNNNRGTQPFNRGRGRGNPDLESIKLSEPAKIVDNLLNTKDLSASIDATKYSTRGYSLFIYIWHKIYFDKNVQQTELNIISSAFLESQFFTKFSTQYVPELNLNIRSMNDIRLRLDDLKLVFELLLSLIDKFKSKIHKLPISAISTFIMDDVTLILDLYDPLDLYASFVGELQVMALKLKEKKMQYMKETQEEQKQIEEKKKKSKAMREDLNLIIQPPDDFQDIDVIPTFHELQKDGIPFLRKMPTEGVFQNTHYYLDVVYRLLREDAIRPLREGISVMSKQQNLGQIQDQSNYQIQKKLNRDLRDAGVKLYDEVALYNLTITRNSPDIAITLRIFEKGKSNWMTSKKLLPGSLVIISKDEFKSFDFFLVSERNGKQMTETSKKFKFIDIQIQLITGDDAAYQQNLGIQDLDLEYVKWDANNMPSIYGFYFINQNQFSSKKFDLLKQQEFIIQYNLHLKVLSQWSQQVEQKESENIELQQIESIQQRSLLNYYQTVLLNLGENEIEELIEKVFLTVQQYHSEGKIHKNITLESFIIQEFEDGNYDIKFKQQDLLQQLSNQVQIPKQPQENTSFLTSSYSAMQNEEEYYQGDDLIATFHALLILLEPQNVKWLQNYNKFNCNPTREELKQIAKLKQNLNLNDFKSYPAKAIASQIKKLEGTKDFNKQSYCDKLYENKVWDDLNMDIKQFKSQGNVPIQADPKPRDEDTSSNQTPFNLGNIIFAGVILSCTYGICEIIKQNQEKR